MCNIAQPLDLNLVFNFHEFSLVCWRLLGYGYMGIHGWCRGWQAHDFVCVRLCQYAHAT